MRTLRNPRVLFLALVYLLIQAGFRGALVRGGIAAQVCVGSLAPIRQALGV